jgi:hypothetical protein
VTAACDLLEAELALDRIDAERAAAEPRAHVCASATPSSARRTMSGRP